VDDCARACKTLVAGGANVLARICIQSGVRHALRARFALPHASPVADRLECVHDARVVRPSALQAGAARRRDPGELGDRIRRILHGGAGQPFGAARPIRPQSSRPSRRWSRSSFSPASRFYISRSRSLGITPSALPWWRRAGFLSFADRCEGLMVTISKLSACSSSLREFNRHHMLSCHGICVRMPVAGALESSGRMAHGS